jgi:hypothetical protein
LVFKKLIAHVIHQYVASTTVQFQEIRGTRDQPDAIRWYSQTPGVDGSSQEWVSIRIRRIRALDLPPNTFGHGNQQKQ